MSSSDVTEVGIRHLKGLENLRQLDLRFCRDFGGEGLAILAEMPGLRSLNLVGTAIRGDDSGSLARMTNLEELHIAEITDSDAIHFERLTHLRALDLSTIQMGDEGMISLGELTQLRILELPHTAVTDAGVARLAGMRDLRALDLSGTKITDASLRVIGERMPGLRVLHVEGTEITDAGLIHLRKSTHLKELNLSGTSITDQGLASLSGLANIEILSIHGTEVSMEGLAQLPVRMPNLKKLGLDSPAISTTKTLRTLLKSIPLLSFYEGNAP